MNNINELWYSHNNNEWIKALEQYWPFLLRSNPKNYELERELDNLELNLIKTFNAQEWYEFLLHKYFPWKFTNKRDLKANANHLRKYESENRLENLYEIKNYILMPETSNNIIRGLEIARGGSNFKIKGLGVAGASGLLTLMYPNAYATVDRFVVKVLRKVSNLPEAPAIERMNENSLSINDGLLLIKIMQRKADENNKLFKTTDWTPRKIDKILWTFGR